MRNIQYAFHKEDGTVMSRVGSEIAFPVLDYVGIGQGGIQQDSGVEYRKGDFNGPMNWALEKADVMTIGRDWPLYKWTKKIHTSLKNRHRKFWGMTELA